jgi:hypothetical protein
MMDHNDRETQMPLLTKRGVSAAGVAIMAMLMIAT